MDGDEGARGRAASLPFTVFGSGVPRHLGATMRTAVGAPGIPPGAGVYSGTPTQVKSRASSASPRSERTALSMNVIPEALAPRLYASR